MLRKALLGALLFATFITALTFQHAVQAQRKGKIARQIREARGTQANAAGAKTFRLQLEGVNREFVVYRPTNVPAEQKTPVVFAFHGTGGNGPNFLRDSGWKEKADEEGITIVCGSAWRYHIFNDEIVQHGEVNQNVAQYTTKWNFFRLPSLLDPNYPNQKLYDDVEFVLAMVDTVKKNYAVDADRFYATGFSNGAQFTSRLAVQLSNIFAAFAPCAIGNPLSPEEGARTSEYTSEPFKPRPVMHVLGAVDPKITHAAGVSSFPVDESAAVASGSFLKTRVVAAWVTLLKLQDLYEYKRPPRAATFRYNKLQTTGGTQEFDFAVVQGMGHVYPNGGRNGFRVVDWFWPFMSKYKR